VRGLGNLVQQVAGLEGIHRTVVANGVGGEFSVTLNRFHELISHAHRVVRVLEEDRRVSLGIGGGAVIAGLHQRPGFALFGHLAGYELLDVRMVDVEDYHFGRTARFATRLDYASEGIESAHEAQWTRGGSAAGKLLGGGTQWRKVGTGSRSPLEEHALGLGQREDGIERILDRVDEAGGALRIAISGNAELNGCRFGVPVPVLRIGLRIQPVASHVEPYRRVERRFLVEQDVHQFVVEGLGVAAAGEIPAIEAPIADAFRYPSNQRAHTTLTLRSAERPVQVLAGYDVGCGHRPVFWHFYVLLLEDGLALRVGDRRLTPLPLELVIGRCPRLGKKAAELQTWRLLARRHG